MLPVSSAATVNYRLDPRKALRAKFLFFILKKFFHLNLNRGMWIIIQVNICESSHREQADTIVSYPDAVWLRIWTHGSHRHNNTKKFSENLLQPPSPPSKISFFFVFALLYPTSHSLDITVEQTNHDLRTNTYCACKSPSSSHFFIQIWTGLSLHGCLAAEGLNTGVIAEISGPSTECSAKTEQIGLINSTLQSAEGINTEPFRANTSICTCAHYQ